MKKSLLLPLLFCSLFIQAQNADSYVSKGNQYYKQTQFDLAEAEYRKALQKDPGNAIAQYNLGNALQKQKEYDESVKVLEKLYTSATNNNLKSASAYNQGVAHTKQKALSELKKKQEDEQKQQQKSQSNMSQREAEQKLKLLQEKEKQLQQRLQ